MPSSILVLTSIAPGGVYESADSAGDGTCDAARATVLTHARAWRTSRCAKHKGSARGRGVWAAARLLLVARLVRGLEAIGPKQHEAVDVPAVRGGATRLNHRGGGRAGGWPRGRVRGGGGVYGRGLRIQCGARRMDGSDQPYTAALSAPCSGMHTASPTASR